MTDFILGVFEITIGMSLFIALLLIGLKLFGGKFTAKCRYIIWALVMLRLAIPFGFGLLPTFIEIPIDTELVQSEDLSSVLSENTDPVTSVQPSDPGNIAVNPTVPNTPLFPNVDPVNPDNTPILPGEQAESVIPSDPVIETPTEQPVSLRQILDIAGIVYLTGAAIFLVWSLVSYFIYTRKILRSAKAADDRTQKIFSTICKKYGMKKQPTLLVASGIHSPAAFGIFRRRIVLPDIAFSENGLVGTLAHEVTHCKRGDLYMKLVELIACSLNWFNPLVHITAFQCEMEMELSCDEKVLSGSSDAARAAYADVMLDIIRRCRRNRGALTTHFNPKKSAVTARFKNILYGSGKRRGRILIGVCLVLCVLAGAIVACQTGDDLPDDFDYAEGIYIKDIAGADMVLIDGTSPCTFWGADGVVIEGLTDGDRIRISVREFLDSSPMQAEVYSIEKLSDGTIDDIDPAALDSLRELGWIDDTSNQKELPNYLEIPAITLTQIETLPYSEETAVFTASPVGRTPTIFFFDNSLTFYFRNYLSIDMDTEYFTGTLTLPDGFTDAKLLHVTGGAGSGEIFVSIEAIYDGKKEYLTYGFFGMEAPSGVYVLDDVQVQRLMEAIAYSDENRQSTDTQGPFIGYVESKETPWIQLYTEINGTYIGRIPYEIFNGWPATDRNSEGWTPGWEPDYMKYYYAEFDDFRWAAVHLESTVLGSGRVNVATSSDGGNTWTCGNYTDDYGGNHVVGIGFASSSVGIMCFDAMYEHDLFTDSEMVLPIVLSRTEDSGKTWERMEIAVPDGWENYRTRPSVPVFDGASGRIPVTRYDKTTGDEVDTVYLVSADAGLTWEWEYPSSSNEFNPDAYAALIPNSSADRLFWHRIAGTDDYLYFCAIRRINSTMTSYTDDPPKDFAIYHINSSKMDALGYIEAKIPADIVYDTVCPVVAMDGSGSEKCEFVLQLTKGDETFYVSFANYDNIAEGNLLKFDFVGILGDYRVNELKAQYPDAFRKAEKFYWNFTLADFKNENPGNSFVYEGYTVEYECESPYGGKFDFHIHLPQLNSNALYAEKWNYIYQEYEVEFGDLLRKTVHGTNTDHYLNITYNTVTTGDVLTIYIIKSHGILASGAYTRDYDIFHYNMKTDRILSTNEFIAYYAEGQFADYTVAKIVEFMNQIHINADEMGNPMPLTEEDIIGVIPSVFGDGKFDVVYHGYSMEGYDATRLLFSAYPTYNHQYSYRLTYHDYLNCDEWKMYGQPTGYRLLLSQRVAGEFSAGYYVDCLFTEDIAEPPESYSLSEHGGYYTPVGEDSYGNMCIFIDHETAVGHLNTVIPFDMPTTAQDYYRGVHNKYFSYDRILNGTNYQVSQNIAVQVTEVLDAYRNGKDPNELFPASKTEYTVYPLEMIRENPTAEEIGEILKNTSVGESGIINFSIDLGDGWNMALPIDIGGFGESVQAYFTGVYISQNQEKGPVTTEEILNSILENKQSFYITSSKKNVLLSEYKAETDYSVKKYTILDLNDDRDPEMVLWLGYGTNDYAGFLVLHRDGDTVYAHGFSYRGFNGLNGDGVYTSSSSAFNMSILKLDFDGDTCTETVLARREGDGNPESVTYYIEDRIGTAEEFEKYFKRYNSRSIPDWYSYDIEEITDIDDWHTLLWAEGLPDDENRQPSQNVFSFIRDLVKGESDIPEINGLGIKDYSIALLKDSAYDSLFRFTFTVTGNSLPQTLLPGTYTWMLLDGMELSIYTEGIPATQEEAEAYWKRMRGLDRFEGNSAVEAVNTYLSWMPYIYEVSPYGKWDPENYHLPYNYICAHYGNENLEISFDKLQSLMTEKFGITVDRPNENRLLSRCEYNKETDTVRYADTRGYSAVHRILDIREEDGITYVIVQLFADRHRMIPSHKLQFAIGEGEVFLGSEIIQHSSYEPRELS